MSPPGNGHVVSPKASDIPMYTAAMAGYLTGISAGRVRRWLKGYSFQYAVKHPKEARTIMSYKGPVVIGHGTGESQYASFLDLIDLLFIRRFLEAGISLQKMRKALEEAKERIGIYHFAQQMFFTDGKAIYVKIEKSFPGGALMELLSGGQWVIAPVIESIAKQIEFDPVTKYAMRWQHPFDREGLIVIDPAVSFGQPSLSGRGISTAVIYDLFLAEHERYQPVCSWLSIREKEVNAAVQFEREVLKAA